MDSELTHQALRFILQAVAPEPPCEQPAGYKYTDYCESGIVDCCNGPAHSDSGVDQYCSAYNNVYTDPTDLSWVLIMAFFTTALMAFGIGANDAANAWGTCVGSGAIDMLPAVVLGGFMDWLGATTLGAGVSDTIRTGIARIDDKDCWACGYCNSSMSLYMLGMMAALLATSVFLLLASYTAMPVSTTHAIVGAIVGVTWVGTGSNCSVGAGLPRIALSWVISPLFSGVIGAGMYFVLHRFVIMAADSKGAALRACPWLYASSVLIMTTLILMKSTLTKHLPRSYVLCIALFAATATYTIVRVFLVKEIERRINASVKQSSVRGRGLEAAPEVEMALTGKHHFSIHDDEDIDGVDGDCARLMDLHPSSSAVLDLAPPPLSSRPSGKGVREVQDDLPSGYHASLLEDNVEDLWDTVLPGGPAPASPTAIAGNIPGETYTTSQEHALFVFRYLLVFVAALEAFAHGANDTGNATGAFTAVWTTYKDGLRRCDDSSTPVWIMFMGGFFVFLGTVLFGRRVIQTMGFGLTDINFLRGFCIEAASATSVVLATIFGMPVSTTHCQVGAVIFVGWVAFGANHVKWSMFGRIVLTWLVTLPLSAGLGALLLYTMQNTVRQ